MCLLLEPGTVESHCSEGGIGDVAAAGHAQDLQLVASPAQADQAVVCDLLSSRRSDTTSKTTGGKKRKIDPVTLWPSGGAHRARLHVDGGEFRAVFLQVFQSAVVQLVGGKHKGKLSPSA